MPHFDSTVSLGNIVTAVVFLITLIKMHTDNITRLNRFEFKLDMVWRWFESNQVGVDRYMDREKDK